MDQWNAKRIRHHWATTAVLLNTVLRCLLSLHPHYLVESATTRCFWLRNPASCQGMPCFPGPPVLAPGTNAPNASGFGTTHAATESRGFHRPLEGIGCAPGDHRGQCLWPHNSSAGHALPRVAQLPPLPPARHGAGSWGSLKPKLLDRNSASGKGMPCCQAPPAPAPGRHMFTSC